VTQALLTRRHILGLAGLLTLVGLRASLAAPVASGAMVDAGEFGVRGDGVHDDTKAIAAALASGRAVAFRRGMTCLIDQIDVPSGAVMIGNGAILTLRPGCRAMTSILSLNGVRNVAISGFVLDGNRNAQESGIVTQDGGLHGIRIIGSESILISDTVIRACYTDGVYVSDDTSFPGLGRGLSTRQVQLDRVHCVGNRRQGMSIISGSHITVMDSVFERTSGTAPAAGVDIEPNSPQQAVTELRFARCVFRDNAGHGFVTNIKGGLLKHITLEGCAFLGSKKSVTLDYDPGSVIEDFTIRNGRGDGRFLFGGQTIEGVSVLRLAVDGLGIDGAGYIKVQNLGAGGGSRMRITNLTVVSSAARPLLEVTGQSAGVTIDGANLRKSWAGPAVLLANVEDVSMSGLTVPCLDWPAIERTGPAVLVVGSRRVYVTVDSPGCGGLDRKSVAVDRSDGSVVVVER
jgi:hypothetical protein